MGLVWISDPRVEDLIRRGCFEGGGSSDLVWKYDDLIRCGGSNLMWQDLVWIYISGGSGVATYALLGKGKRMVCLLRVL